MLVLVYKKNNNHGIVFRYHYDVIMSAHGACELFVERKMHCA